MERERERERKRRKADGEFVAHPRLRSAMIDAGRQLARSLCERPRRSASASEVIEVTVPS
eukprot:COSAG01_NODE_3516_length_5981_cov_5.929446_6_plen_60_part_00